MAPVASTTATVHLQLVSHGQLTSSAHSFANPSLAITITGGVFCTVWIILFTSQHLYYRLRSSRLRIFLVGTCCLLALSGWVLFILAAWLTKADQLALRYGCMGLVVLATWILVFSVIGFGLLLRVKSSRSERMREMPDRAVNVRVSVARASTEITMRTISMDVECMVEQVEVTAEDGSEETCAICLESLNGSSSACVVRPLKCPQHNFHKQCILRWLSRAAEPACPICKRPCT